MRARAEAAVSAAARALAGGAIVAVKGMGGFVLAVDATNPNAVATLRFRKRRPDRPLAVMVRSIEGAREIADLDAATTAWTESSTRPIVLAPLALDHPLAAGVAPNLVEVGVFLPPTPLQALLANEGPPFLVMTSANVSGEPIITDDAHAL